MYMREMGSVELLTREGEIEIAKRIEDGLKYMIQAISACPGTIAEVLELVERVSRDEVRVDEVVDGFIDLNAPTEADAAYAEPVDEDELLDAEEEEEEEGEEEDGEAGDASGVNLEELKQQALEHFTGVRMLFDKMVKVLSSKGAQSKEYLELQDAITTEFMLVRFSTRQVESLCDLAAQPRQ